MPLAICTWRSLNRRPAFTSEQVVKLDPTGQTVLYTTPIAVTPEAMAVDAAGNVYLAGAASSGLATTAGAYRQQPAPGLCQNDNLQQTCTDAFVMKLSSSGALQWATYLGGSGPDDAHAIAVDNTGSPWIAGQTVSTDFPVTPNALQSAFHGEIDLGPLRFGDAFVAKLDPTGGKLLYSTYLGGAAPDSAFGLTIDAAGSAYVTGGTQSSDFPVTSGAFQAVYRGVAAQSPGLAGDAFAVKFNTSGAVVYSTFLGGPNSQGTGIAVNGAGQAAINAAIAVQSASCASSPAAVTVLNGAGSGAAGYSPVKGDYLTMDASGALYTAGQTETLNFLATPHAYQTQYGGGGSDAYAARVDFSHPAAPAIASVLNAATLRPGGTPPYPDGSVAPGELIALFANGLGTQPVVTFNGITAPLLYSSNCQINAVVPFGVGGQTSASVIVQSAGQTIGPIELPVAPAVPGIFTINESGSGQAAIVNQDGTVNSASNPAPRGSAVSIYMTGTGALLPAIPDGSFGPSSPPFPEVTQNVIVSIGSDGASLNANVLYSGQAPTLIAGVTQLNVAIPQNAPVGTSVPIAVNIGPYLSQSASISIN